MVLMVGGAVLGSATFGTNATSATSATASSSVGLATESRVNVQDYVIVPRAITAPARGAVRFHNAGATTHRIVADDGSFDSGGLQPKTEAVMTVSAPGTIRVHCEIHPSMVASVTVLAAVTSAAPTRPNTASSITTTTATRSLAATGPADNILIAVAIGCFALGTAMLIGQRRYRGAILTVPNESAWQAVTITQRHFDDLIARPSTPASQRGSNRGRDRLL